MSALKDPSGTPRAAARHRPDEGAEFYPSERCHILEVLGADADPDVSIARARVEPGVTTELHALDGIAERYLITAGAGIVEIGEPLRSVAVAPGDVVVIPAGMPQRVTNTGDGDLVFYCICTPPWREGVYRALE